MGDNLRFRVQGLEFRGLGCRSPGVRVQGLGFRV